MFRFENPSAFVWLLSILALVIVFAVTTRLIRRRLEKQLGGRVTPLLTASISWSRRRWKLFFQCLCLLFLVLAYARPQSGQSKQEIRSEGVELIFLADVSDSMMAEDVKPNRLGQMRAELSRLIDLMSGNKIGLIGFAGSATVMSPLTTDPAALKMYVDSLSPLSVSSQGTNFQAALMAADEAFDRGGVGQDETTRVTRVIVVASDGEDHEPGALELARKLTDKGIRIFGLVYGTEKGGTIPERDSLGFLKGYKKDNSNQTVTTKVNGEAIQALAEAGKGESFFATAGGNHLPRLVNAVDRLEKTQFESQVATQYDEKFQVLLLVALLLAMAEILLGERKRSYRLWRGRFEVPPA
ncbi:MAG: vWA domain-containing protein [Bdellovibrio sp.]|jgi:Ca-activated chloride channel family protein